MSTTEQKTEKSTNLVKKSQAKVSIIDTDMDDDMRILAINTVERIYDSNISNLEIATQIKETFEKHYYPTWICIVGKNFGCKINAQKRHYFCFQIETRTIILYKYH